MKSKIFLFILLLTIGMFAVSCGKILDGLDRDNEAVSDTSVTPIFKFEGGEVMVWDLNKPWVEPGFHCSEVAEGADDLTDKVIVDASAIDVNTRGLYPIKYTVYNQYKLKKVAIRSVLVTTGVDNLFDIAGTYSQGIGTTAAFMTISESETKGFWLVTNVNNKSKPITAFIADLGDMTYLITDSYYHKKVDLRIVYCKGSATYNETAKSITFAVQQFYFETGVVLGPPVLWTWKKV